MKFLITGITGFVGPHLAKLLLLEGHEVHGLVRGSHGREIEIIDVLTVYEFSKIIFHYGDLKDIQSIQAIFSANYFDGIFHLAAQSHPTDSLRMPILTFTDNVLGSVNLITAIEGAKTTLMYTSTSEVYGHLEEAKEFFKIDDKYNPFNPYAVSKASVELYIEERIKNAQLRAIIVRPFSHTGIRRGKRFSISGDAYQLAKIKIGSQPPILQVGNLNTERVVLDVRDCVRAYYLLMMNKQAVNKKFNICGDISRKMSFYTETLVQLAGYKKSEIKFEINPDFYRKIDVQSQKGDNSALKQLTNWRAEIEIEDTLDSLLKYWESKIS